MTVLGPLPCHACHRIVRWIRLDGRLLLVEGRHLHRCHVVA